MNVDDLASGGLLITSVQAEPLPLARVTASPCTQACPAGVNVKAYVSLIAEKKYAEALETVRRRCPLPGICGRVCHHPCERACRRGRHDEAVSIRSLKRFVADFARSDPHPIPLPVKHEYSVAVIGSGPAGLAAAYDLRLEGYPVTVFESEPEAGGMLRYGIADYRLPPQILDEEIGVLTRAGVEIVTNRRIDDIDELLLDGFDATIIAVGAQLGRKAGIEAEEDSPEIEDALGFLRRVKKGDRTPIPGRVIVVGGGSTAVEAARTAMRLGAESVEILYRRYREELLADEEEVSAAESEGIRFRFLVAPKRVVREEDGTFTGLECVQVGLGEPDAGGRRKPIEIPGTEVLVRCRRVLAAVGQKADLDFLPGEMISRGRIAIERDTAMTRFDGVFAAGDVVSGPSTVIEAIAAGHRAAESARHYLEEGRGAIREQRPERCSAVELEIPEPQPIPAGRLHPPLSPAEARASFREVELPFTEAEAVAEAQRCLRCGPCGECRTCAPSCTKRHVMVNFGDGDPSVLVRAPGSVARALDAAAPAAATFIPALRRGKLRDLQAAGIAAEVLPVRSRLREERCRSCGRCVDLCPFGALSLADGSAVKLEAALCRGCGLCAGVCPTHAASQSALSAEWWSERLDSVVHKADPGWLVLACQRRAGSLEKPLAIGDQRVEVIRFRCLGQVEAGMLLELAREPFHGILLAGCREDRCRFESGARMVIEQLERARRILRVTGAPDDRIRDDWSRDRAGDLLDAAVAKLTGGGH